MPEIASTVDRRTFLQVLGSGLLITVTTPEAWAQADGDAGVGAALPQ